MSPPRATAAHEKEPAKSTIEVQGVAVSIVARAAGRLHLPHRHRRYKNAGASDDLIRNWLRNRNTVEFLGIWERLNNAGLIRRIRRD